jgi:predicted nucleotidyltransferase
MLKNEVIRRAVKEVLDKYENVLLAYLSGSIARSTAQSISDVDVAILLKDNSLEKQADIL